MALSIDENGTIYIHRGDSGVIYIEGLSTDDDYQVYFAIKNKKRETIGRELMVNSNYKSGVKFILTSAFTDLLTVPDNEYYEVYHYGIKICSDNTEDTLFVVNTGWGEFNNIIVYPKIVEGI